MIRPILILLIALISKVYCSGQEIYYYGANFRPVDTEQEAKTLKELRQKSKKKYIIETRARTNKGWQSIELQRIRVKGDGMMRISIKGERLFPKIIFRRITNSEPGLYRFEENARGPNIRTGYTSRYLPLQLEGIVNVYHPDGSQKSVSVYQNNQVQSNQNWLSDGSPYIDSLFYSADQEPIYLPGVAHFHSQLLQELGKSDINLNEFDDDVVLGWVVMETGVIDGVLALRGRSDELNQTLVDIISGIPGEWKPAVLDGKAVRYFMSMPFTIFKKESKFQEVEYSWGVLQYNRY